jgi:hypothetical protein
MWRPSAWVLLFFVCTAQAQEKLKPAPEAGLVEAKCSICHDLEHIRRSQLSRGEWADLLKLMRERGAPIDDAETARILDYLAKNYGREGNSGSGTESKK